MQNQIESITIKKLLCAICFLNTSVYKVIFQLFLHNQFPSLMLIKIIRIQKGYIENWVINDQNIISYNLHCFLSAIYREKRSRTILHFIRQILQQHTRLRRRIQRHEIFYSFKGSLTDIPSHARTMWFWKEFIYFFFLYIMEWPTPDKVRRILITMGRREEEDHNWKIMGNYYSMNLFFLNRWHFYLGIEIKKKIYTHNIQPSIKNIYKETHSYKLKQFWTFQLFTTTTIMGI